MACAPGPTVCLLGRLPVRTACQGQSQVAEAQSGQGDGPPAHTRDLRGLTGGRMVTPEAGDLGLGLSIRNIRQKDIPSAVHHGKIFYQRNMS